MELMQAHNQWLNRPEDERFTSLTDLHSHCESIRERSRAKVVSSRQLKAVPVDGATDGLLLQGPNGAPVSVTHYAFGQLANRAGAPAGYLRSLPAPLAADCVNYGLHHVRDVEEIGVLLTKGEQELASLRACTGPNYGRIWNSDITGALVRHFGDGVTGQWKVPGEFGVQGKPITKESTTLYAGDRDMWVFLADESRRIELPNRRDGKTGSLSRGFFMSNSEVGAGTYMLGTFLFDYMCGNHIVWGATGYQELKIRHTSGAPDRFVEQAAPAINALAKSSATGMQELLLAAQRKKVENVEEFLLNRFTRSQTVAIQAAHMAEENRPIETLWDVSTGVTAYAKGIAHMDARVDLEREAGKVIALAA